VRLRLLKMLHEQYSRLNQELRKTSSDGDAKLLLSEQQLTVRALDEEQKVATEKGAVYANILKNTIMKLKRMDVNKWRAEREQECAAETEKPKNDDGSAPKEIKTGLNSLQEVKLLQRVLTPITDLAQHGYVPAVPSEDAISSAREGKAAAQGWEKCDRCQQRFQVFPGRREEDGALTSGGTCKFHWGKTYVPHKAPGDMTRLPRRYKCCGEDVGESSGCFTCDYHVYKTGDAKTLATIVNFAETPPNPTVPKDRAVSFDCEMGYTVHGLELIRLTAVSWPGGEELLDVLVRPVGEILDLNSRYSGVWPEDMARAKAWAHGDPLKPAKSGNDSGSEDGELRSSKQDLRIVSSPEVARELLFSLISPSTPLIGHGLENDLNSVRIVHPTIIDTVLLYPHKAGLPYRHGLKMLMDVHLNRKIQQETGPKMLGHDSAEDARAAGELVRLKIMELWENMQREGWKVVNGDIISPA
jgi:RNA exonuclease 1